MNYNEFSRRYNGVKKEVVLMLFDGFEKRLGVQFLRHHIDCRVYEKSSVIGKSSTDMIECRCLRFEFTGILNNRAIYELSEDDHNRIVKGR